MQSKTLSGTTQSGLNKTLQKTDTENMRMLDNTSDIIDSQTEKNISTDEVFMATTRCCKNISTPGMGIPIKKCLPPTQG